MNRLLLAISAIFLISCQNQSVKEDNQKKADVKRETVTVETTREETLHFNSDSPLGTELKNAIHDSSTDKYFLEVFKKGKAVPHPDDNKMLSVSDSLFSYDEKKDFFYFVVFTKSMNGADGFYAEAAGDNATDYVIKKTEWFADYFNVGPTLTDQDMRTWANSIVGEIQIEREGEEAKAINERVAQLRNNIRTGRKEYSVVIERFIKYIREIEKERINSH